MSALPAKELTTKQVKGVSFGFYTDEEVKRLSVRRIVSPLIFDNLRNPVSEGLYDPALGPIDQRACCTTCNLTAIYCPGHFGHIELPLPVYNPLIFGTLYRLLKNTCFHCFQFRLGRDEMDKFVTKLSKLMSGDLVGSVSVSLGKSGNNKEISALLAEESGLEAEATESPQKHKAGRPSFKKAAPTSTALEAMKEVLVEFFARVPKGKCANCGAFSPSVKKQGHTKLFKVWTSSRPVVQNQMHGVVVKSILDQPDTQKELADLEEQMAEDLIAGSRKRKVQQEGDSDEDGGGDKGIIETYKDDDEGVGKTLDEEPDEGDAPSKGGGAAMKAARLAAEGVVKELDLRPKYMTPLEVEEIMKRLWSNECDLLRLIYAAELGSLDGSLSDQQGKSRGLAKAALAKSKEGYRMFFVRVLPVAPNKFRPPSKVGEEMFEHAQNVILSKILTACLDLTNLKDPATDENGLGAPDLDLGRYVNLWLGLQNSVCGLMDSTAADNVESQGIRQVLEKKEGLFRKNMMGKRVNFAARSVISPDPYIGAGEIGVPPYFAKRLSFPERVTPWNVEKLREAVIRGADVLPGAVAVEDERGRVVSLANQPLQRREAIAKQLLSGMGTVGKKGPASAASLPVGSSKIVYRHLRDGDLMLTNRQPTLHKPGLMAHRARVLKGERTIRMHYANCATFNADFDGDEINLHLPQDQLARAEGYNIVHADQQFIVPTDGKPIRGLIQDHVCSATLITKRDTFFCRSEYMQLVYIACTPWTVSKGAGAHAAQDVIDMEPPTLLKPQALWTGKQVLSTVIRYFTRGLPPITFGGKTKVPADYWGGKDSGEGELCFQKGYLMCGIIDKNQFGKYGLVHAIQELYGNTVAGQILNCFSRLFTHFLQWYGLTCGFDDLLLLKGAEGRRQALLDTAEAKAIQASAEFVGQKVPEPVLADSQRQHKALMSSEASVRTALSERYRANVDTGKAHDMKGSGVMHKLSSQVVGTCLPSGQAKAFPHNCLSLMTVTGAKGSMVNFSQISCLLGQQELEGRRPPRMSSGKTLPCFRPYDAGARSCGFIGDRFLTGLRPQEYYFHCMAGREGLVDTAVKTSRSGYLQRCLVKNLESLRVHYDNTVRDNCDGSVVQLLYGEDGLDVTTVSYMRQFGFLAKNAQRFAQQLDLEGAKKVSKVAGLRSQEKEIRALTKERSKLLIKAASKAGTKKQLKADHALKAQLPLLATYPTSALGSVSEAFSDSLAKFMTENPNGILHYTDHDEERSQVAKMHPGMHPSVEAETFLQLMQLKFMRCQVAAGEAVGVLAAQSVGEPSTQMTLNTFHMAGRGEANVTLGIPRLREILMTAAARIKTPVMTLHLNKGMGLTQAQVLANRMRKLRLAECLSGISVQETPVSKVEGLEGGFGRVYQVTLQFYHPSQYPAEVNLTFEEIAECFSKEFCRKLHQEIDKETKRRNGVSIGHIDMSSLDADDEEGVAGTEGALQDDEVEKGGHLGKSKKKSEKEDNYEGDEDDEELKEGKLRFRGGRGESATYEAPDEEEAKIAKEAQQSTLLDDDDDNDVEREREEAVGVDGEGDKMDITTQEAGPSSSKSKDGDKKAAGSKSSSKKGVASGKVKVSEGGNGRVDPSGNRCSVNLTLPLHSPKLLMLEIVERVAASTLVRSTANIEKVYVVEAQGGGDEAPKVQTDGINFVGAWNNADIVDVDNIITNDVAAMLHMYGVEAARATIMKEVSAVFNAYGIGVDPRHLCLLSDFMTHQGGYRACNRMGIESSVSPFLKMSFETATHFLTDATLKGSKDDLKSPSARLCVGRVVEVGTGAVELIHNL
ncbi:hypothetical protein CEUSTIGMA_g1469.t1 [Chlamydomonas eustigma]|uniref:DNA-directed RNA polymerase subunit n=1 Tax=Chlamydomonas eustigma TaxID=1157962 RepID=A0A250WTF4_9CHLO|nr:hypothetical protein CEUSTIGMA_g1469.t1 [Chlamydomonas eustigma]|eukprot:GAX74019.1 hypothetical protein CEUSTIGMA_g1469.t1 [Chlamydomonas eustigma]